MNMGCGSSREDERPHRRRNNQDHGGHNGSPGEKPAPSPAPAPAPTPQGGGGGGGGGQSEPDLPPLPAPPPPPEVRENEDKVLPPPPTDVHEEEETSGEEPVQPTVLEASEEVVVIGRDCHQVLDTRAHFSPDRRASPEVGEGELWVDAEFPFEVAMEGHESGLEWKRPGEFAENPILFSDGTTRFDIGQGSAGTCYFLSVLSSLADSQALLKQVIMDDYRHGTPSYRGVFHCRFWRMGEWHDVYTDDFLPYRPDISRLWGSHSSTDPNEMWIPLMEKALAKFYGSYRDVEGGAPSDAFTALTGGLADRLAHKDPAQVTDLFSRVKNALQSGCIVAASVGGENNGKHGLVGNHAYSVTGATVVSAGGRRVSLVRVRNPWGSGEWKGAWSDGSDEWNGVSEEAKTRLQVTGRSDGEFWLSIADFLRYFRDTTICSFKPDFDLDGTQDDLDKTCMALGEWQGASAAGSSFPDKFNNPMFSVTILPKMAGASDALPVVIQLQQRKLHKSSDDLLAIRLDVYRVEGQFKSPKLAGVLDEMTNNTTYMISDTVVYRYTLPAGRYVLVPHTMKAGGEKDFMVRVFCRDALTIKKFEDNMALFMRRMNIEELLSVTTRKEYDLEHHFGQWAQKNSGGQISNESFASNPQYQLQVTGGELELAVSLKQDCALERQPIGIYCYRVEPPQKMPLPLDYLYRYNGDRVVAPSSGDTFIVSYEASCVLRLSPGLYSLIMFMDKPGEMRDYVLSLGYRSGGAQVNVRGYNVVGSSISK